MLNMSSFVPKKNICGKFYCTIIFKKKSVAEAHRILIKIYGDQALSETIIEIGLDVPKIMILMSKIEYALVH